MLLRHSKKFVFGLTFASLLIGCFMHAEAQPTSTATTDAVLIPYRKGAKWGFSDAKKKIVIRPAYDSVNLFKEGLARVSLGTKRGFIDTTGKIVIPLTFPFAGDFQDGRALVIDGKLYGFVDKTGKLIIPAQFKTATSFIEGFSVVQRPGGKLGYIDVDGNELTDAKYDEAYPFSEGMARVQIGPQGVGTLRYGFIDKTGKEVIPLKYTSANDFSDGLAQVQTVATEKRQFMYYTGFIDKTGATVIPFDYGESPWNFSEGLAFVNIRESASDLIIDKTGKVIVKDTGAYHFAGTEFHDGLAKVFLGNKIGYIDRTGKLVIPLIYDRPDKEFGFENFAEDFSGGVAAVCRGRKFALIDTAGKLLTPFKYSSIPYWPEQGLFYVCVADCRVTGYVGRDGTEYFEP